MSVPHYCWDVAANGMICACTEEPPMFQALLPSIPPDDPVSPIKPTSSSEMRTTIRYDESTSDLPDAKIIGILMGIIIVVILIFGCLCWFLRKRRTNKAEELGHNSVRGKLKSSEKQKISRSGENHKENSELHNIVESAEGVCIQPNRSFTGGDQDIPMIDDENVDEDNEDDVDFVQKLIFNESVC